MPLEQTGHRRAALDVFEQERRGPCSAEHDGGLEAPQHIGRDGATPPRDERGRRRVGRLGAVDQAVGVVADLLRRAHRQALGPDDRQRKRVQRGEGFTRPRSRRPRPGVRCAASTRYPGRKSTTTTAGIAEARLAEEFRRAEGEEAAHAGGQRAQRAHLCGEFADGFRRRGRTDDDPAAIVEIGHRGVVATGQTLGQRPAPTTPTRGRADVTDAARVKGERAMCPG